jgi:hypothetical protein
VAPLLQLQAFIEPHWLTLVLVKSETHGTAVKSMPHKVLASSLHVQPSSEVHAHMVPNRWRLA